MKAKYTIHIWLVAILALVTMPSWAQTMGYSVSGEASVSLLYLFPLQTSHFTYTSGKKCISIFFNPSP